MRQLILPYYQQKEIKLYDIEICSLYNKNFLLPELTLDRTDRDKLEFLLKV